MRTPTVERSSMSPVDGVDVHVGLQYYPEGSDTAVWDVAQWDTPAAVWADEAPLDDVSCDVLSIAIGAGRDQPLDRFRTGSATVVLDNPTGRYSPWQTAPNVGTYAAIRPGIKLWIWVETAADTYYRFAGKVDSIVDTWPDPSADPDARHEVTFHAVDYLADLAAFDGFELAPQGAGELTGARIGRILSTAQYGHPSEIDAGTVTVQATTLAKKALDEAGLTTDTERGAMWVDRNGVLQWRDRNGLIGRPEYVDVQAVFGDGTVTEDPLEICYTDLELACDSSKIRNLVTVAREGGSAVTDSDLTSQSLYGTKTYRRLDLIHDDDAESAVIAEEMLAQYAYAQDRIEALTVRLDTIPDRIDDVLGLDLLHLIELRRRTSGVQIVATLQIQAFAEKITPTDWTIAFATFHAADVFEVARWDHPEALWDEAEWGY